MVRVHIVELLRVESQEPTRRADERSEMEVLAVRCCDGSQAANQQSKRVVVRLDARGVWIGRGVVWEHASLAESKVRRSGKASSDCRLGLPL